MTLQINIIASDDLAGTVVINAPVVVRKGELLSLLDALLESHGFTIVQDPQSGFYKIAPLDGVPVTFDLTTRIIPTPTVRPSSLQDVIAIQIGTIAAAPGRAAATRGRINYLDDLGVIVVTDSPRRIEQIQQMVNVILARAAEQQYHPLQPRAPRRLRRPLPDPRTRRPLKPRSRTSSPPGRRPSSPSPSGLGPPASTTSATASPPMPRATPSSSAATPKKKPRSALCSPSWTAPMQWSTSSTSPGAAALQIAQLAERFGFGSVETVETTTQDNTQGQLQPGALRGIQQPQINPFQTGNQQFVGGPVLVVDPSRGAITYNGTASQQKALEKLIASFNPQLEIVEFRAYKIKNMKAFEMADLLRSLIYNEEPSNTDNSNSFLPGSGRGERSTYRDRNTSSRTNRSGFNNQSSGFDQAGQSQRNNRPTRSNTPRVSGQSNGRGPVALTPPGQVEGDGVANISPQDVFLVADESNNQVVVKATARDHDQIAKLIDKLDQRRPQVYIEVQIVSVSAIDDFRLAFEIQAVGNNGGVNTNFGLGTFGTTVHGGGTTNGNFIGPKNVITTLAGMTAAIVRSDQVPDHHERARTQRRHPHPLQPPAPGRRQRVAEIVSPRGAAHRHDRYRHLDIFDPFGGYERPARPSR